MRKKVYDYCADCDGTGFDPVYGDMCPNCMGTGKVSWPVGPDIINLTPHVVNILDYMNIPPSGTVARVSVVMEPVLGKEFIVEGEYGKVYGLPDEVYDVLYIVSTMVRLARPDRQDIVSPAMLVRDEKGQIIGCRALERNNPFMR